LSLVLFVDDDRALLRLVSLLLRIEGIGVETSTGGRDGLKLIDETNPDLVLLDLNMPELDGRSFYRENRRLGYDGPIVICSAYDGAAASRELGAQGRLDKPFDSDDLVALVKEMLPGISSNGHSV
jgi:DNA-binding response OmpR family regulator